MASVATLARPYQDYAYHYGSRGLAQQPVDHIAATAAECGQLIAAQSIKQPQSNPYMHSPGPTTQAHQQYGMAAVLPSHIPASEAPYGFELTHVIPVSRRGSHATPAYGSPHENMQSQLEYQQQHPQQSQHSSARKRSHEEFFEYPEMHHTKPPSISSSDHVPVGMTPNVYPGSTSAPEYASGFYISPAHSPSGNSVSHHHHRLPNQPPPSKFYRVGVGEEMYIAAEGHGSPSVVGQPEMPEPAAKPKGPKLKFTPEDDALLLELKETKNLTWKQIADFFPGRSSGTLQVRYCTKLKAKTMVWTDDMVSMRTTSRLNDDVTNTPDPKLNRLRHSLEEYENDRWRFVSSKVGNGFSAAACKEKFDELNGVPMERRSPVAGEEQLDSMSASAIVDDDGSQSFDGALPQPAAEHQQQPFESALPPHQQPMAGPRRLSDHR